VAVYGKIEMPETMQNRQVQSIMYLLMPSAQADKPSVAFSNCGHQILKGLGHRYKKVVYPTPLTPNHKKRVRKWEGRYIRKNTYLRRTFTISKGSP
jgi:hypothetical protein